MSLTYLSNKILSPTFGPADGPAQIRLQYDYLLIVPKLQLNSDFGLFITAGPSLGFKLKAESIFESEYEGVWYVSPPQTIESANSIRLGATVGIGVRFTTGFVTLVPEINYDHGFTNVRETTNKAIQFSNFYAALGVVL
jgi:hypothetical protein